jgi:ATP-binding cassette subfamily B protein
MKYLLKLHPFVRPYLWQILLNLLILLSITGLALIVPNIIRLVIDDGLRRGDAPYIIRAALILLGLGLLTAALTFVQRYLSEWVAAHIGYDLRLRTYDHLQRLPFTYHDHAQTGQLISRCIEDVRAIQGFAAGSIIEIVQLFFMSAGVVTLLFLSNPLLAAIALLPLVPMTMMTSDFGGRITRLFYAVDNALGDLSARLQENVSGVQVVRAFAREPYEVDRFDETNRAYFHARLKVIGEWSRVMPTTNLLIVMGTILILWFGGQMVMAGTMTVGELVAFNAYLMMLSAPVQQLAWLVNAAGEASAGAQRVFEVLETQPDIRAPEKPVVLSKVRGAVEFRGVSLAYQDEKKESLTDINLRAEPNQTVALIGPTGSGKTSLVNLIPRFYDVTAGAVFVDGVDVRDLDPVVLRRSIGIVLQTSLLFSDTIRENITYGRPEASIDEVVAAAKAAQAHDFIMSFPNGYETIVGERGVTLSGGQRQRVAIARALLMDPRILILDDSTSSVDTQTEQALQAALRTLMQGRTTFIIAHRLATVRRADIILVMDRGRIVQRGTHASLLEEGGLYREIHDLQLSQFVESIEEREAAELLQRERDALKTRRYTDRSLS